MKWVLVGCLAIIVAIMLAAPLHMNLLGALLILVFGFLFSTVSSQLTGQIGSSSNPISGMTVATLLLTCLIFLLVGWTGGPYYVTALSVGAIVCIASSNAGATSQDLKTGFLVGATPSAQQKGLFLGVLASCFAIGITLIAMNKALEKFVPANIAVDVAHPAEGVNVEGTKEYNGQTYTAWGLGARSFYDYQLSAGRWFAAADTAAGARPAVPPVVLGPAVARTTGARVGQILTLTLAAGPTRVRVIGIDTGQPNAGGTVYFPLPVLERLDGGPGTADSIWLTTGSTAHAWAIFTLNASPTQTPLSSSGRNRSVSSARCQASAASTSRRTSSASACARW